MWNYPIPYNAGPHTLYPHPGHSNPRTIPSISPFGTHPLEQMLYTPGLSGHPPMLPPGAVYLMQSHPSADPRQQWPAHPQVWPPGIGFQQPSQSWCGRLCGSYPPAHGAYPHSPASMLQSQQWRQPHPPPGDPPGHLQQGQSRRGPHGGHHGPASMRQPENGLAVNENSSSSSGGSSSLRSPHTSQLRASAPSFPIPPAGGAAAPTHCQPTSAQHPLPEAQHTPHQSLSTALTNGPQARAAQLRALKKKAKLQQAPSQVAAGAAAAAPTDPAEAASCSSPISQAACSAGSPATAGGSPRAGGRLSHAISPDRGGDSESESSEAADLAEAVRMTHCPSNGRFVLQRADDENGYRHVKVGFCLVYGSMLCTGTW